MANKNLSKFDRISAQLKQGVSDVDKGDGKALASGSHLFSTGNVLSGIAGAKRREVVLLLVPPDRVRLWEEHNRRYDLLDDKRCADLIESFKRTGKQEFPAVVRKVNGDPAADYELICGARRHWTAAYLGWDLLIEVRDLDDRQAFTLQDLENRDREDISDYERAVDYQKALHKYFNGSRASMSKFLEVDRGNLSRLLDLADLPAPLVEVYNDLRELKVHHGAIYKKLVADAKVKRRLIERARQLTKDNLPGKKILAELKRVATDPDAIDTSVEPKKVAIDGLDQPVVAIVGPTGLTLTIPPVSDDKRDAVVAALGEFLRSEMVSGV